MTREIKTISTENKLTIIIPHNGSWSVILLTGAWCLIWIIIFYSLAAEGVLFSGAGFAWHILGFFLLWLLVLRTFLWHVRGKEKVTLDENHLKIERLGTFLAPTRKFEVRFIDEFRFADTHDSSWWMERYGFAGGQISFNYWERTENFGQSATREEAIEIAAHLNESLKTIIHHNPALHPDSAFRPDNKSL